MKSPAPHAVNAALCPLCGQPNGCALAAARAVGETCAQRTPDGALACWCAAVGVPETVLARVPTPARGLACVCQRCAQGGTSPHVALDLEL